MRSKKLVNRYVGESLRRLRVAKGVKVQDVARRAGLPASSYSCLEGGWYNINLDNLFRILQVLEAEIAEVWPRVRVETDGTAISDDMVSRALEQARADRPPQVSVQDVLDAVIGVYGIEMAELASGSRRRKLSEARTVSAVLVKEIPQLTLTELSQALGVHISSLSHCTKRLQEKAKTDNTVIERAELVRQRLRATFEKKKAEVKMRKSKAQMDSSTYSQKPQLAMAAI